MKANEIILNTFLSQPKAQFVIPVYQRNYDWMEPQCAQLLNDILEVGSKKNETHFIGSIVFIHDGVYTSSEVRKLVVIDGQQRLTTFSLLYLALYHFATKHGLEEKADEIRETYLINKYVKDDTGKLKLKQSDVNAKAFHFILKGEDPTRYAEYSRVIENYIYFLQRITMENFNAVMHGISCLLFVEISLERGKDDPQRIFESLNSTGLELSQADLIRNYILMGLEPDEQVRIFNTYWEVIEGNARDLHKEESRVSDFIRDFLTYKTKRIPTKSRVYEEFKARYPVRDSGFYNEILNEIKEFSYQYSKLINPEKETDTRLRRELQYIQNLEINICYPFLMPVFQDYRKGIVEKEDVISILRLLQSYTWRRFIANQPTNVINKMFMTLYSEIDEKDYVNSLEKALVKKKGTLKFPTNEEIEVTLLEKDVYNIQAKNRTYFLELLENHNNREFVSIDNPEITVEHIFPQNPIETWYKELEEEDIKLMSEKYLHSIANLTLSGNNGSLSNKSFMDKKTMNIDGKQQGYDFSRLWLNQYLRDIHEWNVKRLKERYKMLLQRFWEIWPYPEVEADEELDTDEDFTVYNAPDPRNRKLDYFIFRDQKIETDEISKMYYHVVQQLFNENPSVFHHNEIKELLDLTNNRSDLRGAYELSPTLFMETGLDNNSKFRRLKKLLPKFNAEEDLLINYSAEHSNAEVFTPEYWEKRTSTSILSIVQDCYRIIQQIDPSITLQYKMKYIGLQQQKSINNFILFIPSQAFVRIAVRLREPEKWIEGLKANGIEFISINAQKKRLKFRLTRELVQNNQEFLKQMFKSAYDFWMD